LVVCCDGRPVPCVFLGINKNPRDDAPVKLDKATELIASCIKKYEENHIRNYPGNCNDESKGDLYAKPIDRNEKPRSECLAYKASFTCLKSARARCRRLPNCNVDEVENELARSWDRMIQYCSQARIDFPVR
jgi:hypothetical protein